MASKIWIQDGADAALDFLESDQHEDERDADAHGPACRGLIVVGVVDHASAPLRGIYPGLFHCACRRGPAAIIYLRHE